MRIDPKPQLTKEEIADSLKRNIAIAVVFAGTFFFFMKILFF
ncbi:MAG: hypothetical protein JWR67_2957 [Mucilaginibacter sp.]|nr:hypothetical protein [Mucilaginibacter sp.]